MKNLELFSVVPIELPSVDYWKEKGKLPEVSGIYFVIRHDGAIAYVGQASSIKARWGGAHSVKLKISEHAGDHRIHYIECDISDLCMFEAYFIHKYTPPLNFSYPKIQANELIRMAEAGAISYKEAFTLLAARLEEFGQNVQDHREAISLLNQEKDQLHHKVMQDLVESFGTVSAAFTQSGSKPKSNHLSSLTEMTSALVDSKIRVLQLEAKVKGLEAMNTRNDANSLN